MKVLYNGVDVTETVSRNIDLQLAVADCLPATGQVKSIEFTAGFTRFSVTYSIESTLEQMHQLRLFFPTDLQNQDPRLTPDPVE